MDLWHGALSEFVRAASSGSIAGDMTREFVTAYGRLPGSSELTSWDLSLAALADALRSVTRREIGVVLRGPGAGPTETGVEFGGSAAADVPHAAVGVATEVQLPLSGRRLDVLLCGSDARERRPRALVVELKQWSDVLLDEDDGENVLVGGVEHEHPSRQALDYAEWLAEYHDAFTVHGVDASAVAYCHNLEAPGKSALADARFAPLLAKSPFFARGESAPLAEHVWSRVGGGGGMAVLSRVVAGRFAPSPTLLARLEDVISSKVEWHLLGQQRVAYQAILAEVRRARAGRGKRCILVRGAPGTGKTVIAVQLLADAMRLHWRAVHSTGGKAFTTALRSKFRGADRLFVWNWDIRKAGTEGLDLALVDEAHRLRKTSDNFRTPKHKRTTKSQIDEMFDASKVAVFFLDENQFVRPDEIGTSDLVQTAAGARGIRVREYDLAAQFRCGGCTEYVAWIDGLLGFGPVATVGWGERFRVRLVDRPEDLEAIASEAVSRGERARVVAGFCWPWSDPRPDESLVADVVIGSWQRPWNRKEGKKKSYSPKTHPYTRWAETDEGRGQIGCIYSAQGFEFESVGVIFGPDLVWRGDRWVGQREGSRDRPVRGAKPDAMTRLVRNAYRVLLSRGTRETSILCLDAETRDHIRASLRGVGASA